MIYFIGKSGYLPRACAQKFTSEKVRFETIAREGQMLFNLEEYRPAATLEEVAEDSTVIFFSAMSKPGACEADPRRAYIINVRSTIKAIDTLIRRGCRVLFCSSDAVFSGTNKLCLETDRQCAVGVYALTKAMVESYYRDEPQFIVIRLSYVYGRGDPFTSYAYNCLREDRSIEIFDGYYRHAVPLETVTDGILRLALSAKNTERFFNFCGDDLVDRRRILELCDDSFLEASFKYVEAPESYWDVRAKSIRLDNKNFKELIAG
jgi:dTDP-4-dehydrorhamnose reductase